MWQSERSEKLSLHHRRGVTWSSCMGKFWATGKTRYKMSILVEFEVVYKNEFMSPHLVIPMLQNVIKHLKLFYLYVFWERFLCWLSSKAHIKTTQMAWYTYITELQYLSIHANIICYSQQKWEKSIYNILNMDIFLTKMQRFATGGLYSPPLSHVRHVLLWIRALYLATFGLLKKNTRLLPF